LRRVPGPVQRGSLEERSGAGFGLVRV
jgi:hypothetical protein